MNNNPIGIFDSGLGGLSVWRKVRDLLPEESLIYFGDGLNCPYGSKPASTVREYAFEITRRLLDKGVKLIIIACNTATAAAIAELRTAFPDTPFVGMEPAVKPAALSTHSGVVAVLATEASFEGELYKNTALKYGRDIQILAVPGTGFVELVERNAEDSPEAREQVGRIVKPLIEAGADRIVLGCTHYPFLRDRIAEAAAGSGAEIIDPAPAVARQAERLLDELGLRAGPGHAPQYDFMTLGGEPYMQRLLAKAGLRPDMDLG